jgi:hypothetical protein
MGADRKEVVRICNILKPTPGWSAAWNILATLAGIHEKAGVSPLLQPPSAASSQLSGYRPVTGWFAVAVLSRHIDFEVWSPRVALKGREIYLPEVYFEQLAILVSIAINADGHPIFVDILPLRDYLSSSTPLISRRQEANASHSSVVHILHKSRWQWEPNGELRTARRQHSFKQLLLGREEKARWWMAI